jgi:hypothetical protein
MMKKLDSVFIHPACTDIGNMLQKLDSYSVTRDDDNDDENYSNNNNNNNTVIFLAYTDGE